MSEVEIAFIGGSGLYKIPNLKKIKWKTVKSSFGKPSWKVCLGSLNGKSIAFLPRHGINHNISPSKINYRANIDAFKKLGVTDILSLSSVGSLNEDLSPGVFVVINQYVDLTKNRITTFFDNDIVVHVSMLSLIHI